MGLRQEERGLKSAPNDPRRLELKRDMGELQAELGARLEHSGEMERTLRDRVAALQRDLNLALRRSSDCLLMAAQNEEQEKLAQAQLRAELEAARLKQQQHATEARQLQRGIEEFAARLEKETGERKSWQKK